VINHEESELMKRICVFCGSNSGANPAYVEAARCLGSTLAARGIGLVYGGGKVGLMGELANSTLARGGEVTGVIPQALFEKEVAHTNLTALHVVDSMHDRKGMMGDLADAFITLPGGFGTMEEFFEVLTWAQLGIHRKACGLLNVDGYYDGLLALFDSFVSERFARREHRDFVIAEREIDMLLDRIIAYVPPALPRWVADDER
jgi:uncharacterized protein (TIGR00730 family)